MSPQEAAHLLDEARKARAHAYAPYSRFPVGAALLSADGRIFPGCNVENASFGLTLCAERVAVGAAVSAGAREYRAIAVVGPEDDAPCAPCGACRQVLYEFGEEWTLVTPDGAGGARCVGVGSLLPGAFGPAELAAGRGGTV